MEKADKEIEIIGWMNKQGYDRRASKEVAPIIVEYLSQHSANGMLAVTSPIQKENKKGEVACLQISEEVKILLKDKYHEGYNTGYYDGKHDR